MRPRREVLELIGAYAAGELAGAEEREIERLLEEDAEHRRVAESYARMLALLSALGEEPVEAPEEEILGYVVRRAYASAFLRQAEHLLRGLAADYLGALTFYLGLRSADRRR